ncbi:PhzF family phenazine biosynthesis protein [Actinomadura macrotermitis]|uniref:Trans-2,3-dihydro-3-hydroxyanthranilate isomerase n=1 Tax=Actinomadura macrotermitis TaxID=2585200 RepID=A0A7K0C0R2_9ACTN|nr:PhzF family phenazine biosynthesis protein [Actinomadura macrotermitis]MQY06936.1 Trans-2,3-dihydro-3-hydroxyanthranilate isomerase [Actinomadura macrotermitis]
MPLDFHHVDVFADRPYSGNSLAVFVDPPPLDTGQMARVTQELRHFESIFLTSAGPDTVRARVFDLIEELDFAGHPLLGAAAVLHELRAAPGEERRWTFELNAKTVQVTTRADATGRIAALLDAGRPEPIPADPDVPEIAAALGLDPADLHTPEVISTGLRYLVVPVRGGGALARARIGRPGFEDLLKGLGAQFAYVLDVDALEARHWDNDGVLEDVATGSAAGCAAAHLLRRGRIRPGEPAALKQGRFTGRPSTITITAYGTPDDVERVTVGGTVCPVGTGTLRELP